MSGCLMSGKDAILFHGGRVVQSPVGQLWSTTKAEASSQGASLSSLDGLTHLVTEQNTSYCTLRISTATYPPGRYRLKVIHFGDWAAPNGNLTVYLDSGRKFYLIYDGTKPYVEETFTEPIKLSANIRTLVTRNKDFWLYPVLRKVA